MAEAGWYEDISPWLMAFYHLPLSHEQRAGEVFLDIFSIFSGERRRLISGILFRL